MKDLVKILAAAISQQPGKADSEDKDSPESKNRFKALIRRNDYDLDLIKDLLVINSIYNSWKLDGSNSQKSKKNNQEEKLFYIAGVGFMAKLYYSNYLVSKLSDMGLLTNRADSVMPKLTFNHQFLESDSKTLKDDLFALFEFIKEQIIDKEYKLAKKKHPEFSNSNFFDSNFNYIKYVAMPINKMMDKSKEEYSRELFELLDKVFYKQNMQQELLTKRIVKKAIDEALLMKLEKYKDNDENCPELSENGKISLLNNLKDFRTAKYKETGKKAFQILTNSELEAIYQKKPQNMDELLGCLRVQKKSKAKLYGEEILKITCDPISEPVINVSKEAKPKKEEIKESFCPICGKPTFKLYGHYRKDGLCLEHGKQLKEGKISFSDGLFIDNETGAVLNKEFDTDNKE